MAFLYRIIYVLFYKRKAKSVGIHTISVDSHIKISDYPIVKFKLKEPTPSQIEERMHYVNEYAKYQLFFYGKNSHSDKCRWYLDKMKEEKLWEELKENWEVCEKLNNSGIIEFWYDKYHY